MTSITANSLSAAAEHSRDLQPGIWHKIHAFWREISGSAAFNPYRPELHYMRGPGPAWRAKHGVSAPTDLS